MMFLFINTEYNFNLITNIYCYTLDSQWFIFIRVSCSGSSDTLSAVLLLGSLDSLYDNIIIM